ncbi:ARF/SAR [Phycomyces nitens]|nr:ARF/SAR [Phycomyces nitens]
MGANLSSLFSRLFGKKEAKILMVGLDGAGKTTILYQLKLKKTIQTIQTVVFNVEFVDYKNIKFNVWDLGGQLKIRNLWRHYYTGTQCLVFVVDAHDHERIAEASRELHRVLSDQEMQECIVLVLANKQDLQGMSLDTVINELNLHSIHQKYNVLPCCAITGKGLQEALYWISQNIYTHT